MTLTERVLRRPIATILFWLSVIVAGAVCWLQLPIAALPDYDTPVIQVTGDLPGASPETMSTSVATPLEKQFSAIPGLIGSTSSSYQGQTRITLEFDASRPIDAAAGDVQAALYRATRSLPADMPTPPSYKKINPADAPVLLIGLSSPTLAPARLNGYADNLIVPALSTLKGVAQVNVTGHKRFAVRIEVDPQRLAGLNLSLAELGAALKTANANTPIGQLDGERQVLVLQIAGGMMKAADFAGLIVATRGGQPVRLGDVATLLDSIENLQNASTVNGDSSILLQVQRQPGANTVATIDAIHAMLPRLRSLMPPELKVRTLGDRSLSIRQAIHDVSVTMLVTIALVVLVILLFLRHAAATLIPSISLPISLLGTFALMYVFGLSLNNISLMGLTIAVGLVVDDAIVVLENIMRYLERGMAPYEAARQGAAEVGFTVISISISLVAVFIPVFFMPGTIGLLFHEFAIVVSLAILVSAAVSLTLIPVLVPLCIARPKQTEPAGWSVHVEAWFGAMLSAYARALEWALAHRKSVLAVALSTLVLMTCLYLSAPRGFFPQEDLGLISAEVETPQDMSYEGRLGVALRLQEFILSNPSVKDAALKVDHDTTAFTITLKDKALRPPIAEVIAALRKDTSFLPDIQVFFTSVQNLKVGGRSAKSSFQYTLQSVSPDDLDLWANRLLAQLKTSPVFIGLNTDSQKNALQATLQIDRDKAALLQLDMANIRAALYAAYGGRQVSTIYAPEDSYQVIMELDPASRRNEADLAKLHVRSSAGALVPLGAFTTVARSRGTLNINHQGQLPAVTLSFDLAKGRSLSDAAAALTDAQRAIALPPSIFGAFAGQAALFQQSQTSQLWLILIAVAVIYVVLGMLYESWIHPVTILLGIPSAAVGALIALRICGLELTFIAMIGILLLIGVVKKNAIMMIDFALEAQRSEGMAPSQAIRQACLWRFRPIMMTTLCALMGALPLALGIGAGAELRQPLGVAIVGGLVFSQMITLFITPVLFLSFDAAAVRLRHGWASRQARASSTQA